MDGGAGASAARATAALMAADHEAGIAAAVQAAQLARQSGAPLLRFADLATDTQWLQWARHWAPTMLTQQPQLAARHVQRWLGGKSDFVKA